MGDVASAFSGLGNLFGSGGGGLGGMGGLDDLMNAVSGFGGSQGSPDQGGGGGGSQVPPQQPPQPPAQTPPAQPTPPPAPPPRTPPPQDFAGQVARALDPTGRVIGPTATPGGSGYRVTNKKGQPVDNQGNVIPDASHSGYPDVGPNLLASDVLREGEGGPAPEADGVPAPAQPPRMPASVVRSRATADAAGRNMPFPGQIDPTEVWGPKKAAPAAADAANVPAAGATPASAEAPPGASNAPGAPTGQQGGIPPEFGKILGDILMMALTGGRMGLPQIAGEVLGLMGGGGGVGGGMYGNPFMRGRRGFGGGMIGRDRQGRPVWGPGGAFGGRPGDVPGANAYRGPMNADVNRSIGGAMSRLGIGGPGAAGAIAGLMGESAPSLDPTAFNTQDPGGGSGGIGQWNRNRLVGPAGVLAYAMNHGVRGINLMNPRDILKVPRDIQIGYMMSELQGPYRGVLEALRNARTPQDALWAWITGYERPANPQAAYRQRAQYLQPVLASLGGGGGGGTATATAAPPAATSPVATPYVGPDQSGGGDTQVAYSP